MARARNIKPGFFRNELLAELSPLARLLFAGLWTVADRSGRLEDRPRRIKADVLPYDDCDVEALLTELDRAGFVRRYGAGSGRYIQVVTFARHQNPHKNEAASTIPAPEEEGVESGGSAELSESDRADSLIPDTGYPIPGSGEAVPANAKRRPQRLPEAFAVTDEMRTWAAEATGFTDELIGAETEKFRDHFRGTGVAKVDWVATWRNWLRKAVEYRAERGGSAVEEGRPWLATPDRGQPFDFFATKRSA